MSELVVGSIAGLAANSYEVGIASGSTLNVTNASGTLPASALPGLAWERVTTVSFSAVSSVSLESVFSADYDYYRILVNYSGTSGNGMYAQFQQGTTPFTSTYVLFIVGSTHTTGPSRAYSVGNSSAYLGTMEIDGILDWTLRVNGSKAPFGHFRNESGFVAGAYMQYGVTQCGASGSENADGVILQPGGGTITGDVVIYGMRTA